MARIKFGMMMTDARGKLGGQVFSKTRSGAVVRTKVTPTNPQTAAQSQVRSILGQLSARWKSLAERQRQAWNDAVASYPRTNAFGDTYLSSGKNLFTGVNQNILNIGGVITVSPPELLPLPYLVIVTAGVTVTALGISSITLDHLGEYPGGEWFLVVEATSSMSAGRYNFSGSYRKVGEFSADAQPPILALGSKYTEKFGSPTVGDKVSFRCYLVNQQTGQRTPANIADAIVRLGS